MIMNFNSKILIISLILIFAITVSAVSANEDISDVQSNVEQNASTVSIDDVNTVDSINSNQIDENNLGSAEGQNKVSAGEYGTFTELQNLVNEGKNITLTKDYMWDISFKNGDKSGVLIDKSITIDGNGHTIDGAGASRLFNVSANVTLKNIHFNNWNFDPTQVIGSSYQGAGIYAGGNNITFKLINCEFKDFSYVRLDDYPLLTGAVVYTYYTNTFVMDNCIIHSVHITDNADGAVFSRSTYNIITNSYFDDCYRGRFLGQFNTIKNTTFNAVDVFNEDASNMNFLFDGCKFINNSKLRTEHRNISLNIKNSTFTDSYLATFNANISNSRFYNSPTSAISLRVNSKSNISDCYFYENHAVEGGAIFADRNAISIINNCHFINNTVVECGGAIFADETSNVTVNNPEYVNNKAGIDGNDYYKAHASEDTIFVGPDGNGTGSDVTDLASIKYALNNIKPGGTIYFTAGIYRTNFEIYKPMTLVGLKEVYFTNDLTISHTFILVSAPNVEINNFNFKSL